ncbi:N-acetyltransferase [Tessaracoccus sp. OH4464_COT-324]|uniref:GNAT family N-acetyltransferase n=1 Tax=Tessaracoccus sp. OH4464_COT-324 TaxID=2491059 RepID=UPI000F63C521|nr:GNAT family N-acetyltransferase [Tessaracoccus sp. OH4464_COT-324]RRD47760.1 GNAT family N-acetyltransferase [Tessaracoccus sp. OH4464_COT-324]
MSIVVRLVVEEDLPVLRAHQARPELNLVDEHFALSRTGRLLFAVAYSGDSPLGTALLDLGEGPWRPELRNMWVYPQARRRGAGRALSHWLEEQARNLGFPAVYLAVDPNNIKAIPLYISLDYLPTGEHIFVEDPEVTQVEEGQQAAEHYAVYKKSLTAL